MKEKDEIRMLDKRMGEVDFVIERVTEKAIFIYTHIPSGVTGINFKTFSCWLPKSQVKIKKVRVDRENDFSVHYVEIPKWLKKAKNIDAVVNALLNSMRAY